jgi:serine/threonine protein kinase
MPLLKRKDSPGGTDRTRDLLGHVFESRYRIERHIGQGGIGVVYQAIDTKLAGRSVAVKVLSEKMGLRKKQRRRFEREARALAALSHPNIVSVIDYGVADHVPYLVMELLEGKPLSQVIAREAPLEPERALRLMNQVLAGLCYVHERNIVHRDLKPGNLFVQTLPGVGERVKLLDFGLAKFLDPGEDATLTASGEIFGTPGYMPPEQMLGKPVDTRADVYSACVLLYEMLTGIKPFGSVLAEVVQRQLTGRVPSLADAGTGRAGHEKLEALLARGMATNIDERFRDARQLAKEVGKLPKDCTRRLSDEERAQHERSRHEAVTRVETTEAATVADAPTPKRAPTGSRGRRSSPGEEPGLVTRGTAALSGLFASALRAGAILVAVSSLLVILGAAIVIYVFKNPELESSQEALRRVLPGQSARQEADVAFARAVEESARQGAGPVAEVPAAHAAEPGASRPQARDPWKGSVALPLRRARAVMLRNGRGDERTLNFLRRYNGEHTSDASGHLLLGGFYMNRKWLSDAVQQYELAFSTDPGARGDMHAQRDLLGLASAPADVWGRARALLVRTYGRELADEASQAAKKSAQPAARARLLELAEEVGRLP